MYKIIKASIYHIFIDKSLKIANKMQGLRQVILWNKSQKLVRS